MLRKNGAIPRVISALTARSQFGQLLDSIDGTNRSMVIAKRGTPRAVVLSIRDYVRLAAPEPEVLRLIGEASQKAGTDRLSSKDIDRIIRDSRRRKRKSR